MVDGSKGFSANLDILRAVAVLLVLGDHVVEMIAFKYGQLDLTPYNLIWGRLGVLLFFVHTALVLNFSMERMRVTGLADVRSFYIRRAFRLYPLSILCVSLVVLLGVPSMPWAEFEATTGSILSNLALTTNLTYSNPALVTLWSLPVEAQMYLALPVIYLFVRRRPALVLLLWLASLPTAWIQPVYLGRFNVLAFVPCFLGGVLAYTLSRQSRIKVSAYLWLPTLLALIAGYVALQARMPSVHFPPIQWMFCLLLGAVIPIFSDSASRSLNKAAALVAKYSYGIYMWHLVALWLGCIVLADQPAWLQWSVVAGTIVLASVGSYHLVEEPAIRYGARVARSVSLADRPVSLQALTGPELKR